MALISCISCGARISDKAVACPKCGWTNQSEPPTANAEQLRIEEERKAAEELKITEEKKVEEERKAKENKAEEGNEKAQVGYDPGLERSRSKDRKRKDDSLRINMGFLYVIGGVIALSLVFASSNNQNVDTQFLRECSVSIKEDFSNKCFNYFRDLVGGKRKFNKLLKWVNENMSEREINEYNNAIDAGNAAKIQRILLKFNQKYLNSK